MRPFIQVLIPVLACAAFSACGDNVGAPGPSDRPDLDGGAVDASPEARVPTTISISAPTSPIVDTLYTYEARPAPPAGARVVWNWGDGSPDTEGLSVRKVWHRGGSFKVSATAQVGAESATASAEAKVMATPLSVGLGHACGLKRDGTLACWGSNNSGELGNGASGSGADRSSPVPVAALNHVVSFLAGGLRTCALEDNNSVWCWGFNPGDGTTGANSGPIELLGLGNVVQLAGAGYHGCTLDTAGNARCWGLNNHGQLGDGTTADRLSPAPVVGLGQVLAVDANVYHTCAVKADGSAMCWGSNALGELGDGAFGTNAAKDDADRSLPVAVRNLRDVAVVRTGITFTCALRTNGSVSCWGTSYAGQLGDGSFGAAAGKAVPGPVSGLTDATSLVTGTDHACALRATGAVVCWGNNTHGQIGDGTSAPGTMKPVPVPVVVSGLVDVVAIGAGSSFTCALSAQGSVKCWGANSNGQLGDATTEEKTLPSDVAGGALFWAQKQ